jgi:hypothetical protein
MTEQAATAFSIAKDEVWTVVIDGREITYTEVIRQEYANMLISAGTVEGDPVDTLYISLEREGKHAFFLLMRPDEFAALSWCLTGALWSNLMSQLPEPEGASQ